MNRKTFLSSLLALITAPFLVKSKENEWIKANPALLNGSVRKTATGYEVPVTVKDEHAAGVIEELSIFEGDHLLIYRDDGDGYKLVNKIPAQWGH